MMAIKMEICDIELRNINVLIGSNGVGKSNFISAFEIAQSIGIDKMINECIHFRQWITKLTAWAKQDI